jgi:thiamine pyrophosphate-dependent acetolactate synthase large subunit-like protein
VWQTGLRNPDFAQYARNCGAFGVRVESPGELDEAMKNVIEYRGPSLLEIVTDPQLI